ncbi:MAG: pantoate--beta-alanine ligase [Acidobacteriota bacterium]
MKIARTVDQARRVRHSEDHRTGRLAEGLSWGFVPTMGFLHEAHLSLVRRAAEENDRVVVSLFVNPMQFNESSDFETYPRDEEKDLSLLRDAGVDLAFLPAVEEIYPPSFQTHVDVEGVSEGLEGAARPGHFRGVATVLTKLFHIVAPTRAYFGQKDAQQVAVTRQLVEDLAFGLEVVACPTLRESDGLAMSSRNVRLTAEDRRQAVVLYQALEAAAEAVAGGERDADRLRQRIEEHIATVPRARVDYISLADPRSLQELQGRVDLPALASLAVFFGDVRLIDNVELIDGGEPDGGEPDGAHTEPTVRRSVT